MLAHSHARHHPHKKQTDSDGIVEVVLQPGDFHFGAAGTRVRTLLGSCVSITLWHPKFKIGGMCHFMLPQRENKRHGELDGKYADEAIEMFLREIKAHDTSPSDYEAKVFGGGNMFPKLSSPGICQPGSGPDEIKSCRNISCKNIAMTHHLVKAHGFNLKREDLGGEKHRFIIFDIANGHVWVRRAADAKEPCAV